MQRLQQQLRTAQQSQPQHPQQPSWFQRRSMQRGQHADAGSGNAAAAAAAAAGSSPVSLPPRGGSRGHQHQQSEPLPLTGAASGNSQLHSPPMGGSGGAYVSASGDRPRRVLEDMMAAASAASAGEAAVGAGSRPTGPAQRHSPFGNAASAASAAAAAGGSGQWYITPGAAAIIGSGGGGGGGGGSTSGAALLPPRPLQKQLSLSQAALHSPSPYATYAQLTPAGSAALGSHPYLDLALVGGDGVVLAPATSTSPLPLQPAGAAVAAAPAHLPPVSAGAAGSGKVPQTGAAATVAAGVVAGAPEITPDLPEGGSVALPALALPGGTAHQDPAGATGPSAQAGAQSQQQQQSSGWQSRPAAHLHTQGAGAGGSVGRLPLSVAVAAPAGCDSAAAGGSSEIRDAADVTDLAAAAAAHLHPHPQPRGRSPLASQPPVTAFSAMPSALSPLPAGAGAAAAAAAAAGEAPVVMWRRAPTAVHARRAAGAAGASGGGAAGPGGAVVGKYALPPPPWLSGLQDATSGGVQSYPASLASPLGPQQLPTPGGSGAGVLARNHTLSHRSYTAAVLAAASPMPSMSGAAAGAAGGGGSGMWPAQAPTAPVPLAQVRGRSRGFGLGQALPSPLVVPDSDGNTAGAEIAPGGTAAAAAGTWAGGGTQAQERERGSRPTLRGLLVGSGADAGGGGGARPERSPRMSLSSRLLSSDFAERADRGAIYVCRWKWVVGPWQVQGQQPSQQPK